MNRILLILIILLHSLASYCQSISVSSFQLLDTDLTANTAGSMELDQNGETAALIKVVTTQTGFTFDGGALGIVKTVQKPSEIWVYVPRGLKKITISHPQLGMLRDYYFNIPIEAAKTYELVLVTGEVQTIVKQKLNSQYLVIKVTPPDAVIELDNEILPTSNGVAQKFVKLGSHDYRIQAQDYYTAAGKVNVDDPNNKKILDVDLQPAFGWIEIPSHQEYNGAQVFIDNTLVGTIPMKSKGISSGDHIIKIVKPLYNPYTHIVTVKDNETTMVTPILSANYSEVTITVGDDADIYVNEEKKGKGKWIGKLASGIYMIEAKKEGHRSSMQSVEVSSAQPKMSVVLTNPTPIYGELNVTSNPTMAEVYVDGKSYGQTPLFMPNFLVGSHDLSLRYKGYEDYNNSINIKEGETAQFNVTLIERKKQESTIKYTVKFKSGPYMTAFRVDGCIIEFINPNSILSTAIAKGKHKIEVFDARKCDKWNLKYTKEITIVNEEQLIEL